MKGHAGQLGPKGKITLFTSSGVAVFWNQLAEGEILFIVSIAAPTAATSHGNFTERVQRKVKQ